MVSDIGCRVNIGADQRLEPLLGLPKCEKMCVNGSRPTHLRSLNEPGRERVVRFACKSWCCRICSVYLRHKYGMHFGTMILRSWGSLFSARVDALAWGNKRKLLNAKRAEWVRVNRLVIWCEPPEDDEDTPHADTEEVVKLLGHELRAIDAPPSAAGTRFRPVSSSHGWKIPDKPKTYERLGWATVNEPSAVVNRLEFLGIQNAMVRKRKANGGPLWDVVFVCPDELRGLVEEMLQH
jgi:hypothetical protein